MDEVSEPVTAEELREFLEADVTGVRAAPAFKRRLRSRLWELMKARAGARRAPHPAEATEAPQPRSASGPLAR